MKEVFNKALYILLPLAFMVLVHAIVSFVVLDINPVNWTGDARTIAVILYLIGAIIGIGWACSINDWD